MTRGESKPMTIKNTFWLAVAMAVTMAVFAACGSVEDAGVDESRPVAELTCDTKVCTLLVYNATDVYVYSSWDPENDRTFYPLWKEEIGYVTERRLTYRFPTPDDDPFVVAQACNLAACVQVVGFTQ